MNRSCFGSNSGGKMFKRSKLILLLIALLPAIAMAADHMQVGEMTEQSNVEKKYKLSVCALFKNEAPYLKEWLEYHRMVGVDHFYLYDNGSKDRLFEVLAPYIKEGVVTLTRWLDRVGNRDGENAELWVFSTQLPAYGHAVKYFAVNESEWLVFLDVDEFMVPVAANSVKEILECYHEYPGVELTSDFFDASNEDPLSKKELLIANVDLTNRPTQNILKSVEKMIFKPECNTSFTCSPYKSRFKDNKPAGKVSKAQLRINKYVNRATGEFNFGKLKQKLRVDSRSLTESEKCELLEVGYAIEDKECVIHRFEPGLRKKMGIEPGWSR
jgi:hypothetical protein